MGKLTIAKKRKALLSRTGDGAFFNHRVWRNRNKGSWFITVFEVSREYGGPEEGGWYYETGEPVTCYRVKGYAEACKIAQEINDQGNRLTSSRSLRVKAKLSRRPLNPYPERKPHYC